MSRFAVVLTLTMGMHASAIAAPERITTTVPGQVQRSLALPATGGLRVVSYERQTPAGRLTDGLAVVAGSGTGSVVWQRETPGRVARLAVGAAPNVFIALGARAGDARSFAAAFQLVAGRVRPAIRGASSGILPANRGARLTPAGFVIMRTDSAHVGTVPYRVRLRYAWSSSSYRAVRTTRVPDLAPAAYPVPNAVVHTTAGSTLLLRLWVAADTATQNRGLMYLRTMDPDQGMIFVWSQDVREPFWMENTYIPLTVAFLSADGTVQEMQDMAPLTTVYHTPRLPYRYAIEVNQGYFEQNGVRAGDRVDLHLG